MHIYEENAPFRCFSLVFSLEAGEVAKNSIRKHASQIPCIKLIVYVLMHSHSKDYNVEAFHVLLRHKIMHYIGESL